MKLALSKNANSNYLAKVVRINSFHPHRNPEVTKLKCCTIDGFNIITGINEQPGLYIYFPTACCINPDFLCYCNLYKHKELNKDPEQTGMFEDNGRVKAIKLKTELSEGFIISATIFKNYILSVTNKEIELEEGTEFDIIEHEGKEFWINKKYSIGQTPIESSRRQKSLKSFDQIINEQFRFHYNTILVKKCPNVIHPYDLISITEKVHGTSGISAYVLCKQKLNWKQKIAKWLTGEEFNIYDYIYASRSVIKNRKYNKNVNNGFYGHDVWKYADNIVSPNLIKGMTAYYEIIGFLPNGNYIQNNYDYDCVKPKSGEEYTYNKHFKIRIYRITLTNVDGEVHEFSAREVQQWSKQVGLVPVKELYYGIANNLYSEIIGHEDWSEEFIDKLANDPRFYMEQLSPSCKNNVPHEGLVIKNENMKSEAFKLKCFKFLDKEGQELDAGITNIEA